MLVVYFSSVSENTSRFVDKVGLPSARIPLHRSEGELVVEEPFILITPTYGGGAGVNGEKSRPVPPQVIRFLNNEHNRSLIRGVIAAGNSNFGADFCRAGEVVSDKCQVPYLFRFELMGAEGDAAHVREQLTAHARRLGLVPLSEKEVDEQRVFDVAAREDSARRLAQLRKKYSTPA